MKSFSWSHVNWSGGSQRPAAAFRQHALGNFCLGSATPAMSWFTQISGFIWSPFCTTACIAISGNSSAGPGKLQRAVVGDLGFMGDIEPTHVVCGKHPKPTISTTTVLVPQYDDMKCHTAPRYYTMSTPWWENRMQWTSMPEVVLQLFKPPILRKQWPQWYNVPWVGVARPEIYPK